MNLDLLSKNKQKVIDYKNVLKSNNISIINKINKQSITRINRKGEDTIIDHVLANRNQNGFSEIILKDTPLNDHKSIEFEMNVKSMKKSLIKKYKQTKTDYNKLKELLDMELKEKSTTSFKELQEIIIKLLSETTIVTTKNMHRQRKRDG
ncbi:hypothetical protein HHI36_000163 [Cryptolaemus montrouzieri]|uniref:Uncharacterized protein n=1 Tax=Cryptolaemus montrouzieri TaxID=559131 RepID=A0ABD2P3U5_9CUCU